MRGPLGLYGGHYQWYGTTVMPASRSGLFEAA